MASSRRVPIMAAYAAMIIVSGTTSAKPTAMKTTQDSTENIHQLEELIVSGTTGVIKDKIGQISMSGAEINLRPVIFGENDLIKALQTTAGVVAGTEGFAGMYVRGGETDQNLYLLDGLPLLNVYHVGGLFSSFSTHSIDRVDFYKGFFPSSFGERASSIVDVASIKPDLYKKKGTVSIGLISGQIYYSSPIRKGYSAVSLAARRTWLDAISTPMLAIMNHAKKKDGEKKLFRYNFTDIMLRISATDQRNSSLSLLLFYNNDKFHLGETTFDEENTKDIYKTDLNRMTWGNRGITANYNFKTSAYDFILQPYVSKVFASDTQENTVYLDSVQKTTATTEMKPSVLQVGMKELLHLRLPYGFKVALGMQQTWYDYNVGNPQEDYGGISDNYDQYRIDSHSKNVVLSAFSELHWHIADIVNAIVGLRGERYLSSERRHWTMQPRVSLILYLPGESAISSGYSRMAQYAQQVSSNYIYLPSDAWLPIASYNNPLVCDIYSLGYNKTFSHGINLNGEIWLKQMYNLAEYRPNTSSTSILKWQDKITVGRGWAYGLDIDTDGKIGPVSWIVGYGLMWNWRKFHDINEGRRYPAKFDNRHKLDISLGWTISDRMELTAQWEYMTGNRTTLALYNIATPDYAFPEAPFDNPLDPSGKNNEGIDYFDHRNNVRLPSFHRLNLNLTRKGRFNQHLSYQWDFGLYNAYCRMNPFSLRKSYVRDAYSQAVDYRKFKTLGLIPVLPSVSFTLNL